MKKYEILNANTLKMIALISMVVDHIGVMLFPNLLWLRCIGRISLPIFAYMVAEGAHHTKDPKKYFLRIFILGVLCQAVYFVAYGTLYLSTLISFSLSIPCIFFIKSLIFSESTSKRIANGIYLSLLIALVCVLLFPPKAIAFLGIQLDYGVYPFLIPVVLYFLPTKEWRLAAMIPLLYLLSLNYSSEQLLAFLAIPILLLYNGKRGKTNLKYFFYVAYPLHLVLIFVVYMFLR